MSVQRLAHRGPVRQAEIDIVLAGPDRAHLACGACRTVLARRYHPRPAESMPAETVIFCPVCESQNRVRGF